MISDVGIYMIFRDVEIYMTTNVAVIRNECRNNNATNVVGDDECALRTFRISDVSWITCFSGISGHLRISHMSLVCKYHGLFEWPDLLGSPENSPHLQSHIKPTFKIRSKTVLNAMFNMTLHGF